MPKAKKPKTATLSAAVAAAAAPAVPILPVPLGGSLTVVVDVTNPSADYAVTFGDNTLIFDRVDREKAIKDLKAGSYILGWTFRHFNKGWAHTISAQAEAAQPVTLESRSEAKKDDSRSIGFALVVVS